MCLVHGGGGFHVLSQSVFNYFCGRELEDIIASSDEVDDFEVRSIINEVILH